MTASTYYLIKQRLTRKLKKYVNQMKVILHKSENTAEAFFIKSLKMDI